MANKKGLPKDHISFTQIKDYIDCPKFYYLKYHTGTRPTESFPLKFGAMQHDVVLAINQEIMKSKENISFEDVEKIYEKEFKKYHFDLQTYQRGKENMRAYTLKTVAEKSIILKAEYNFRYPLKSGAIVEGRIDRIDIPAPEAIEVIDFKSSPLIPSNEEMDKDIQLSIYAYIISLEQPEIKTIYVSRQSLECEVTKTGQVKGGYKKKIKKDLVQLQDTGEYLQMIYDKISAEKDWKPNPEIAGHCQYCPKKCDTYYDLAKEKFPDINIKDIFAVGRQYIQVTNQKNFIEKKQKDLKALIEVHFESNLKRDIEIDDKIIYISLMHKDAEKEPRPASDYSQVNIGKNMKASSAINKFKRAMKKMSNKKKNRKGKK